MDLFKGSNKTSLINMKHFIFMHLEIKNSLLLCIICVINQNLKKIYYRLLVSICKMQDAGFCFKVVVLSSFYL